MELCHRHSSSSSSSYCTVRLPKAIKPLNSNPKGYKLTFPTSVPHFVIMCSAAAAALASSSPTMFVSSNNAFDGSPKVMEEKKKASHLAGAGQHSTDEILMEDDNDDDDDDFEEFDDMEEQVEPKVGDGEGGGGISLGGTVWGSEALAIAEEIISLSKDLEIFAFKASNNGHVYVRLDKLSDKYGSPGIDEIETFSSRYTNRLEEAKVAGTLPYDLSLEVSSPGAERVVRVPRDLERFKDLPMYVRYMEESTTDEDAMQERDGIFQLDNVEMELGFCTWRLANVKENRRSLGKGRSFNKKQREWRLRLPFTSLLLVRLYLEI